MSNITDAELTTEAEEIRDETDQYGNTKERIYQMFKNMIDSKPNNSVVSTIDRGSIDTTSGIVIDLNSLKARILVASPGISANKIASFANVANAITVQILLTFSSLVYVQFPSNVFMSDARWDGALKRWTPFETGQYKLKGTYDGTNWTFEEWTGPYT